MKLLKKLAMAVIALCMVGSVFAFAACGNGDEGGDNGGNENNNGQTGGGEEEGEPPAGEGSTLRFEAEHTDVSELLGFGPSGSPVGLGLIQRNASASGGAYLAYLGEDSPVTFTLTASAEVTGALRIRVGSNSLGTCTWDPQSLVITVNDQPVSYSAFETSNGDGQNFKTVLLGDVTLNEGENEIVFVAGDNKYLNNLPSAPSLDYIMLTITSSATVEMEYFANGLS